MFADKYNGPFHVWYQANIDENAEKQDPAEIITTMATADVTDPLDSSLLKTRQSIQFPTYCSES